MRAEWTKLRTVPSTPWLLAATALALVAVGYAAVAGASTEHCPTPAECFEDTTRLSLNGVRLAQVMAAVLAVLAVGAEFGTGTIALTLTAEPRRLRVLLDKAAVLTAAVGAAGTAGVAGSLLVGRAVLPGHGFAAPDLTDGTTLRAAAGTVLYLVLIALLALGLGTALRDSAGGITAVLALLFLSPVLSQLVKDKDWHARLEKYTPMPAGLAVQATERLNTLPIGPWKGLGVLACYTAAALVLGGFALTRRAV
ncbi:ABC transporter permease [Actinomadura macrotermitis]|uniref:ABC transporter permease n=1 Tax=Actinomadura macrotermitis TaxID=2585200 RepID=A0A7K0BNB1_9ACTN|nr:ABC transporter permease [Actinomadura macrotermitis]MQY02665.1 hypothetical protein [Actinomadura macrotermitis]